MQRSKIVGIVLLGLLLAGQAFAAHPDRASEISNLKQRIEALEAEGEHGNLAEEEAPFIIDALSRHLIIGGALEVEAGFEKTKGEDSKSELNLATAELVLEAELNEAVSGHLVLLYEEEPDDDNLKVDEAVLSLTCPQPLLGITPSLHAGRLYVPFGTFNSFMVSDPFTVDIGETQATAALLALESDYITLKGGVFNGTVDTGRDTVDSIVASAEITPVEGVAFGASWISDLAESGAELVADPALYNGSVAGGSTFVSLAFGPVSVEAEALTALRDFDLALVNLDTTVPADGPDTELSGKRPRAWNLELAIEPVERLQIAGRYEEMRDFAHDARRYGGTISWGMFDQTVLAVEYLYTNRDSENVIIGDKLDSQTLTAQLAMEF